VYYTQGAAEAAIAAMKEGKSEVMCEQGQLYKVSKSKAGVVKKRAADEALDRLGRLLGGRLSTTCSRKEIISRCPLDRA
jgi:hypothetical protein